MAKTALLIVRSIWGITSDIREEYKFARMGTAIVDKLNPKRRLGNPKDEPRKMLTGIPRVREVGNFLVRRNYILVLPLSTRMITSQS